MQRTSWLHRIANLNVYRAKYGPAPHKPLMLLVIFDLAEEGEIPHLIPMSPELAFRFFAFWSVVSYRRTQRPDIALPFHHLSSDGVWEPLDADGNRSSHKTSTAAIRLDDEFRAFIVCQQNRQLARQVVIETYFPPHERIGLYQLTGSDPPKSDVDAALVEEAQRERYQKRGRDARFRVGVVGAYRFCCALTGLSILTSNAMSIVDAAHIHAFSDSRNDDPRNGLALCKNAHWLFDQGLWSMTDDCTILVADSLFVEVAPDQSTLRSYAGKKLRLPDDEEARPHPEYIGWHRKKRFLG